MNFLACDGDWLQSADGSPICSGSLVALTVEEMQSLYGSALTWDQVSELQGEAIVLFATVFGFLVLKKALKQ
ncbi:MAG: hypothetical protein E2594_18405 [Pseudomonas sp.]|uniref:hypothetical protein n=1 Tax=Stutzerimonas sp. FeSN7 TaxID=3035479 RepID=UPI0012C320CC|nr:hypothetical protein [Stutzerimonas sp. FeSN7]MDL2176638.1 hypothetical protein [Stutzerimonas sp. FeSN7]MPS59123.1 hypothetical protein [Pseudomonas sp.]